MEALSRYVLSVIAAAFLFGILSSMVDEKGSTGALLRLMGGLFLIFSILSPILKMDFTGITNFLEDFAVEGEYASASGEEMAEEEYRTIIIQQVEAYILDKASGLGLSLTVEVTLNADDLPESVTLCGAAAPYAKLQLQQIIEDDLGIAKENQRWTGER